MTGLKTKICVILFIALCLGSMLAVLPIINRNADKSNLVVYFNHDEGFIMDLVWYYYSGIKSPTFRFEHDYGLEFLYLSDFLRLILSRITTVTRETCVLLLRWLHVIVFWIASIIVLWRFARRHLGGYWRPLFLVLLLVIRPAYPLLVISSKSDLVALFFVILGLDYLLRLIEKPSRKSLIFAVISASIATLVKYAGVFLLPAIIAALYFSESNAENRIEVFPRFNMAWLLPALAGSTLVALPLVSIFFYVRQTTGLTWYEQSGFWKSVSQNPSIALSFLIGASFILFSGILKVSMGQKRNRTLVNITEKINTLLSYSTLVSSLFAVSLVIVGFRWVFNIKHFIQTVSLVGLQIFGKTASLVNNVFSLAFLEHFFKAVSAYDIVIFFLFIIYIIAEIKFWPRSVMKEKENLFKRITLALFTLQVIPCMLFLGRLGNIHMLPFFITGSILTLELIRLIEDRMSGRMLRKALLGFIGALLIFDVAYNTKVSSAYFADIYHEKNDIIFDIAKWLRKNYAPDTPIVADHPTKIYVPEEYKNVRYLTANDDGGKELRGLVSIYKPRLIYYNITSGEKNKMRPIEKLLPGTKLKLVASFSSADKSHERYTDSEYVIYEVIY